MVMCAYYEARNRGEKHGVAVRYAVDDYKQRYPQGHISETEVKRTLAMWRPRGSGVVFLVERQSPTEEFVKKLCWSQEQFAKVAGKDLQSEVGCSPEVRPRSGSIVARFGERPNYPRHNRKDK